MFTRVFNLATEESKYYSLPPRDAVIAAYQQERGNYNTWTYSPETTQYVFGRLTVTAGNWTAFCPGYATEGEWETINKWNE